ncbi:ATP-dependent helicase fft2 [Erysiphe neolycopersici]|uniref:DNA helicase n=1 Tax=Erysiphe neolycopersici TaxID=212602 RepID=A0A420HJG5_9PEZI|nr:ATP-dependent helicase fft2 [Erysiphe neolycopersici]
MAFDLGSSKATHGTPSVKRQKTSSGYNTTSIDEYVYDESSSKIVPETPDHPQSHSLQAKEHLTLPQLGMDSPESLKNNHVQVPASSPFKASNIAAREDTPMSKITTSVNLSSHQTQEISSNHEVLSRKRSALGDPLNTVKINLNGQKVNFAHSEKEQYYQLESSSEEFEENSPDIIPANFNKSITQDGPESSNHTISPNDRFKTIIQGSAYKGPLLNNNQLITTQSSKIKLEKVQNRIEKPLPIKDISLDEITDEKIKTDICRLRSIFPSISILQAKNSIVASNGSFEQAADLLAEGKISPKLPIPNRTTVSLVDHDIDEFEDARSIKNSEPEMKRTLKVPTQSIRDRYSSTQNSHKNSQIGNPVRQKKRLVQGRRNSPNPVVFGDSPSIRHSSPPEHISLSDGDSENESFSLNGDEGLEARVLKYLNTCDISGLVELANISKELAEIMLAARPFQSLDVARTVENAKKLKSGKKSTRSPIGDKIVDTAIEMLRGYEAIDTLVRKCVELSKPLASEISEWGFDIYGAQKNGELEMTSLEDVENSLDLDKESKLSQNALVEADNEVKLNSRKRKKFQFLKKPNLMAEDCILKDYQVVGMNWLALMYRNGLSGILADEMGLGKTCQVISFLAHLVETGKNGPHLVVCPGSTLENWLREINRFAPKLTFEPYHGPQKERQAMADEILQGRNNINIVVTTYDMAAKKEDNKFLRRLRPDVCVYDEGHMLKNVKSQRYQGLIRIPARFRLLLTGTPLQNNLQELAALLAFILPDVFKDLEGDLNTIFKAKATTSDSDHTALLSTQRIDRARSILTPFVLRRKKAQVLKHLPTKHCRTEYCALHNSQREIYEGHLEQARQRVKARLENSKMIKTEEKNPLMQLRKAAIHPLLFRRHFDDAKIEKMADILRKKEPINFPSHLKREHLIAEMHGGSDFWLHQWCRNYPCIAKYDIPDLAWMDSGKVEAMIKLVKKYKENGDRVLLFSQFSLVLDIIEAVLNTSRIHFTRIDGSTKIDERQSLIDDFRDDESITVFLLTTKAGGTGINLMYANKVIIFDGSFNPQDDKQAENRAHRVGQTREVEVVRLVTKGTVEEQILALGDSKLLLDGRVAGDEDSGKMEAIGEKTVARMLFEGTETGKNPTEGEIGDKTDKKQNGSRKKNTILRMLTQKRDKVDVMAKTIL